MMYPNCMPGIMILAQAVLQIFCSQGCFSTKRQSWKREIISVKYLQNFAKSKSGYLHLGHILYAKYHDPSSKGSSDILFTRFHRLIMAK